MKSLCVRSRLSELNKVRAFIKRKMKSLPISEEDYYAIELSILEVCINIIRYAYPENEGEIFMKTWTEKNRVYMEIKDNGIAFDPRRAKKPDIQEIMKSGKKGGLGVFLTRKLMDGFEYRRHEDQNVLTMYKRFQ